MLTDTGCEVGAAWNKSAEDLICTLAIRNPRQRAAINDFIGELAQRAAEVGLEVAILRESPPEKRPTIRPTFRPTGPVARLASHLIRLQNSRVGRVPRAPTTRFGRAKLRQSAEYVEQPSAPFVRRRFRGSRGAGDAAIGWSEW